VPALRARRAVLGAARVALGTRNRRGSISFATLLAGVFSVMLQRPRKRWLRNHYNFMGWSYVGLWAAFGTEITVRVVRWPLAVAVIVPTVLVVFLGGALVRLREQHTIENLRPTRSAA